MKEHSNAAVMEVVLEDIPSITLRAMYVTMLKIRKFEERVAELVALPKEIICPSGLKDGESWPSSIIKAYQTCLIYDYRRSRKTVILMYSRTMGAGSRTG